MRYELSDYEWTAIKPMLPNKPRGVRRVNDRRVLSGIFWVLRSDTPGSGTWGRAMVRPQSQDGAARNCRRHVGSSSL
jgi:transposase